MKKKQLRKENEALRKRVDELECEKLALEIKLYAIGRNPNSIPSPPWEVYVSDGLNPYRPMYGWTATSDEYWRGVDKGWPPGYFDETAGCLADDPIKRWPQCNCD